MTKTQCNNKKRPTLNTILGNSHSIPSKHVESWFPSNIDHSISAIRQTIRFYVSLHQNNLRLHLLNQVQRMLKQSCWIRCFTITISARRNRTSSKLKKYAKLNQKTRKQRQLLSESSLSYVDSIAPLSLSYDRRIKIKKPINQVETKHKLSKTTESYG